MGKYILGAISAAILASAAAGEDAVKAELKKLDGTWQLVSAVKDGEKTPEDHVKSIRMEIKDGKHTVYFGEDTVAQVVPFTIDPRKDPKTLVDILFDGKRIRWIYKLDGDTLTTCVAEVGRPAPSKFAAPAGTGHTLRVFKRANP